MDAIAIGSAADRRDLFVETARIRSLSPVIVEKDFWVCWTLRQVTSLDTIGPNLIFKGGTSLSKVFGLIRRFSEDIDLSIRRDYLGFEGETDPEARPSKQKRKDAVEALRRVCGERVRTELLPALSSRFEKVLGPGGWSLTLDEQAPDTLNFTYPSAAPGGRSRSGGSWTALPYIRPAVRLELGAGSDPYPVGSYRITPYAAEAFPQAFKEAECSLIVLEAERTFWEKATLIHAEHHRPADKPTPLRISRHHYDLHQLAQSERGRRALAHRELLRRVAAHKQVYFASGWARYEIAATGGLRLVPPEPRLKGIEQDYEQMRDMFFGPFPRFEEILATLQALETEINTR